MPIQVDFEIPDEDLERFVTMARQVKAGMPSHMDSRTLARLVRVKLEAARNTPATPLFILERIGRLEQLADMVADADWGLDGEELDRVRAALFYFVEPEDLVPDRVPVLGFLDDALMVELTLRDFVPELEAYEKFCGFREAERHRREGSGKGDRVTREDWLADQRAALRLQMRQGRKTGAGGAGGWKVSLW